MSEKLSLPGPGSGGTGDAHRRTQCLGRPPVSSQREVNGDVEEDLTEPEFPWKNLELTVTRTV